MHYFSKIKLLILVLCASIVVSCSENKENVQEQTQDITFANLVPLWWNAQPLLIDFDAIPDVEIKTVELQTGKESKNIVLNGGADIGIVAASPLVLGAVSGESGYQIVARYMDGPELVGIFSTESENAGLNEPIAVVNGTVSEFVLRAHATRNAIVIDDSTNMLNTRPPSILSALKNNDAKSAVIWEPFAQQIAEAEDLNLQYSHYPKNLYSMKFFIIVNKKSYVEKRVAIDAVINEFANMSAFLVNDSESGRVRIEDLLNYPEGYLTDRWDRVDFTFVTDKETIERDLATEADIIIKAGIIKRLPNFSQLF